MKKKARKNRILIFLNVWSNEFSQQVLEEIIKEAKKDNVDVFVFASWIYASDNPDKNHNQLNLFKLPNPEEFDGAIVLTNSFNLSIEEEKVKEVLENSGIPVISTEIKVPGWVYIGTDNYKGEYDLARHLLDVHKCKDLVYISGLLDNKENEIRKQAIEDALAEKNLVLSDTIVGDFGYYVAREETRKWIKKNKKLPDAFVCANDLSALGTVAAVFECGYSVPQDVLVTGFDYNLDGRTTEPILATVKREWDKMGVAAYKELYRQIDNPDPNVEINLSAEFIPSESCGCPVSEENDKFRKKTIRNKYADNNEFVMLDYFFKELRMKTSNLTHKEDFNGAVKDIFDGCTFMGDDFWVCTEPAFFEIPNSEYTSKITRISRHLDVLYSKEEGVSKKAFDFNSDILVPKYKKKKDESNVYVFAPLTNLDYIIGYVVAKNNTELLYKGMLYNWLINMISIFNQMRNIVFAQKANEQLRIISMTDQLTGMYNRLGLSDEIGKFINENRNKNVTTTLLFADIDSMKFINDFFGHLKGDLAIKAAADALKEKLAGEWNFARFGGDEFVIVGLLEDGTDIDKFRRKLMKDIKDYIDSLELGFPLSISIGITQILPKDKSRLEDYIKIADDSMYQEKEEAHMRIKEEMKKYKKQIL